MKSFCNPKYVERYEDVVFDLETALNTTVVNNARQKKDGYRFVVDNSGEVTPFYWYNARISLGVRSIRKSDFDFGFWILDFPIKCEIQKWISTSRNPFPRRISIKAP